MFIGQCVNNTYRWILSLNKHGVQLAAPDNAVRELPVSGRGGTAFCVLTRLMSTLIIELRSFNLNPPALKIFRHINDNQCGWLPKLG